MTALSLIRRQLRAAAEREPQSVQQPIIAILRGQLRRYATADNEERSALRPVIQNMLIRLTHTVPKTH